MADIKYDIIQTIGILSENARGWKKGIEPHLLERW